MTQIVMIENIFATRAGERRFERRAQVLRGQICFTIISLTVSCSRCWIPFVIHGDIVDDCFASVAITSA